MRRGVLPYDTRRTVHTPRIVIHRDRAVPIFQEPRCEAKGGPGSTTSLDCKVTCEVCREILKEDGK